MKNHILILLILVAVVSALDDKKKVKKDIRDYSDADIEKLYDEWEVGLKQFLVFQYNNFNNFLGQ